MSRRIRTAAALLLGLVVAVSLLAPLLGPWERDAIDLDRIAAPPSSGHPLGTDRLGRDVLTRLLYGGRYTLLVAGLSVAFAAALGAALGGAAGWLGGAVDRIVAGLADLFLSVPVFLVMLVAAAAAGGRIWTIPLVIGGMSWMETARVVRSRFAVIRREEYVEAARAAGAGGGRIVVRHLLPQAASPIAVAATAGLANAMLVESSLSFLGFGVQPPVPTWGNMLTGAVSTLRSAPAAALAPGLMIFATCFAFNLLCGDRLAGLANRRSS
ncbi:MAG: ABC transporter permease [Candidatus Krumholzibacteria bacterium]|nr:ABC transporter permease [Candidatus Krumholzibacteria bacterium]